MTYCRANAVNRGNPTTTPIAVMTRDLMSLSCGLGCLSNKRRIVPAMPAILARAVVKNIGLKSRTATRVAGKEPAKMTIPIKPYIHPLVECFKPDSYVLVLCSRWQKVPCVTASSSKKRSPSKGWSCAVWWSRGELYVSGEPCKN